MFPGQPHRDLAVSTSKLLNVCAWENVLLDRKLVWVALLSWFRSHSRLRTPAYSSVEMLGASGAQSLK